MTTEKKSLSSELAAHILRALREAGDMLLEEAGDLSVSWDGDDLVVVDEVDDGEDVREVCIARVRIVAVKP